MKFIHRIFTSVLLTGLCACDNQEKPRQASKESTPSSASGESDAQQDKVKFLQDLKLAESQAQKDDPNSMKQVVLLFIRGLDHSWIKEADVFEWGDRVAADGYGVEGVLGTIYLYGSDGVTRNPQKAIYWFGKAIERKGTQASNAQYMLGLMYAFGDGVTKDPHRAVNYLLQASDGGVAAAMFLLGQAYIKGELGLDQDTTQGLALIEKAANKGDVTASMFMGHAYAKGTVVNQSLAKAMQWYQQAAKAGNAHAQYILGLAYLDGTQGLPEDYKEAVRWLKLAAGQDHVDAMLMLSACYSTGKGTDVDNELARVWKERAIELNNQRKNHSNTTN